MDWLLISLGIIALLAGILGCILPILPGPPMAYVGLILLQFTSKSPFTENQLIWWGLLAAVVTALDYIVPIWGTRKFGGSKKGVWGSIIGLILGFSFPPFGLIIGPFIGAVVGEMMDGKDFNPALRAGFGSFIGFLAGTMMKFAVAFFFTFHFIRALL